MFELPASSIVNRVIPKNSFDKLISNKQKKQLSEYIDKIKWTNKLSSETINLIGNEINEIQVFEILLKKQEINENLLNLIDRNIPYHIIFILIIDVQCCISIAQKHMHPIQSNTSVIDWRFNSNWFNLEIFSFKLNLKNSLDDVFADFCAQVNGNKTLFKTDLSEIIIKEQKLKELKKEVSRLESAIKNTKQFNIKVELNIQLQLLLRKVALLELS